MDPISISIMIGVAIASAAASAAAQMASMQSAMAEQNEMMREQTLENSYKDLSQKNQTLDKMREALETNEAHMSATGMAANSPSFVAVNAETIDEGDKAMRNADVAQSLNDYTLKIQQQAAHRQAYAQELSSLGQMGSSLANSGINQYGNFKFSGTSRSITGSTSNYIDNMFSNAATRAF